MKYAATMATLQHRLDEIPLPIPIQKKGSYEVSADATKFFNELLALIDGGEANNQWNGW